MSNNPYFSDNAVATALEAVGALVNGGGNITIYSGTQPNDANAALSGNTALAVCNLSTTAFSNAGLTYTNTDTGSGPVRYATLPANAITSGTGTAGTATWFRCYNSTGTGVFDGSVGTSGADLNLNTTAITTGATVQITSFTITQLE
jgi:hypothetical protein